MRLRPAPLNLRHSRPVAFALLLLSAVAAVPACAAEASMNVVFTLDVSNSIAISGAWAPTLPNGPVTPGSNITVESGTYYLQYSCKDKQHDTIRVQLTRALPTWLTLQLQVTPTPGDGTSAGWVTPTATGTTVAVRSIPTGSSTGSPGAVVTYRLVISNWSAARAGALSTVGVNYSLVSN